MNNKRTMFDLLVDNNEKEIDDYFLANGKSPKSICPIMFENINNKQLNSGGSENGKQELGDGTIDFGNQSSNSEADSDQ